MIARVRPTSLRQAVTRRISRMSARISDESGAIAIIVGLLMFVFLALAAIAIDLARIYVEAEEVQKAADAAALAGVTHMPQDLTEAQKEARAAAARNGYAPGGNVVLTATPGRRPSQLHVSITSQIDNGFAAIFGSVTSSVTREATADFQGPIPMASPCNTFGNEPTGTNYPGAGPSTSSLPTPRHSNCSENPQFWASIQGPQTDKTTGDQYMTRNCGSNVQNCSGGVNAEFRPEGYFFVVRISDPVATGPVTVQLYDPAFIATQTSQSQPHCEALPNSDKPYWIFWTRENMLNDMWPNEYTRTDGRARYNDEDDPHAFCTGDYPAAAAPGYSRGGPVTTSFALRAPTDTQDPKQAPVISNCVAQFRGTDTVPDLDALKRTNQMTRAFHQWVPLCTITNPVKGDYYLQVRTNVALPGGLAADKFIAGSDVPGTTPANPAVTTQDGDDTSVKGGGTNSFAIRALSSNSNGNAKVAVSGFERMPMSSNSQNQLSTFNLIKALPGSAGRVIEFSVYDAGDEGAGTMTVLAPPDATGSIRSSGSIQGCTGKGPVGGTSGQSLTGCSVSISQSQNQGKIQTIYIPVPADYNCDYNSPGGCWFSVRFQLSTGTVAEDTTTWTSRVLGDPVRLVR